MRPYTASFARKVGRGQLDEAIDEIRGTLKGDASDAHSLEMIAQCHHWAGRPDEAISACREALKYDSNSFPMLSLLARLLADRDEHENAAIYARKGLESYPEPLKVPRFVDALFKIMSVFIPRLRGVTPTDALKQVEAEDAEWFAWAKQYLDWYDSVFGDSVRPPSH